MPRAAVQEEFAGTLNHLFSLLQPTETGGNAVITYLERGRSWGRLLANTATGGLESETLYTVIMHPSDAVGLHGESIDTTWQLGLGTRRFRLVGAPMDPEGLGKRWSIQVSELTL